MRILLGVVVVVGLAGLVGGLATACGGSSSETPWPIEPVDTTPRLYGEPTPQAIPVDQLRRADAGATQTDGG